MKPEKIKVGSQWIDELGRIVRVVEVDLEQEYIDIVWNFGHAMKKITEFLSSHKLIEDKEENILT